MKRSRLGGLAAGLALAGLATLALPALAQDWKGDLDRLWNDHTAPERMAACQAFVVRAMPPMLRGSASGRSCLIKAIAADREGDRDLALAWLRAAPCRDRGARRDIERAGEAALAYAVARYGGAVP